ncbi:S66 peptidase family protein [Novosphingobium album (ex Liu et al. 2023)]|uniref:LD-carboxypeptidase n=1 Tax=Novosphingobium album (ex Liu et al. 2023) TaxID=3031130 RepID=A0ABT5WNI1_9SPHN|nr:LD-carboxypeptidase [Novosphingobium album (ex Liu et al. 2023)]MDE8651600.1 LD-carboxypeptidase [Novosphingobium album (ex Liu et al. 2023)]
MLTRRSLLAGLGGTAAMLAAPAIPAASPGSPASPRPPRLREGDTLGLVAPAGFIADRFGIAEIEDAVRAMGLVPRSAPHMLDREGYLAGSDATRARDLTAMFADPEVRAIMAVRGGWGCARILPHLDFAVIRAHPKLLVGSSDVTALHLALAARTGIPSIHGPNAAASWPPAAWQSFHDVAFDAATPTYAVPQGLAGGLGRTAGRVRTFRSGKARGRLLGGNLSVLSALVGTPYLPDFSGAILFLEDTNEAEYRIDRMLTQLALAGILGKVAGVVFGQCTNCENPGPSFGNFTVYEVLDRQFADLRVPAFQGALIGHIASQVSIPVGVMAEIDADTGMIHLLEPAVA